LVAPASGEGWQSVVSLRVEDHPEPLVELRRLVDLHDAYALASKADDCINEARHDDAARLFERARALAPGNHELLFWAGLGAAHAGDVERGVRDVRAAIELQPGWRELLQRMPPEVAPSAQAVLDRLRESA
jgi:tetratricopeptide (TPR) repeat protein